MMYILFEQRFHNFCAFLCGISKLWDFLYQPTDLKGLYLCRHYRINIIGMTCLCSLCRINRNGDMGICISGDISLWKFNLDSNRSLIYTNCPNLERNSASFCIMCREIPSAFWINNRPQSDGHMIRFDGPIWWYIRRDFG